MKSRILQLSILRAFAALSIITIHVTSGQVLTNGFAFILNQVFRFGSPIFVMISGFILYYLEKRKPSPSYFYFFKHRFSKVAVPYLLWTLIYSIFDHRQDWLTNGALGAFIEVTPNIGLHLLTGTGYVHLYFVLIMIQLYAVFPFFYRWITWYPKRLLIASFFIQAAAAHAIYFHQIGWFTLPSIKIAYTTLALNWIFYFVFGLYVAQNYQKMIDMNKKNRLILCLSLVWVGALALHLVDGYVTETYAHSVKPSTMFYSVASFLLFFTLLHVLDGERRARWELAITRGIEQIAGQSFLLYLLHPLCLSLLVLFDQQINAASLWLGTSGILYLWTATLLSSSLGIYLINRVPKASWLGGTKPNHKPLKSLASTTIEPRRA
ncbi:acyltransferase [Ammoniphilus sp. YIM 78166]|uniref:acyltransferase n=1 Tax=Ammoniphilus sp. YIM 78166 TaxID=1644106 RepID=UPI00106F2241|nr:acyltransferase [Ammoniphilus sp. YIM 78166]